MKDGRASAFRVVVDQDAETVDYLRELASGCEGGAYLPAVPDRVAEP
jgi:hypothetical protein